MRLFPKIYTISSLAVTVSIWSKSLALYEIFVFDFGFFRLRLALFLLDGQENAAKCTHQDSEGSDAAFGDISNESELKLENKAEDKELEVTSLIFNGEAEGTANTPCGSKQKTDTEKKFACGLCGQTFRTKSYLNKHQHRVHKKASGTASSLGDLASPFSPQQNMSLLESFGFQIVQSAFASSLVDSDVGSNAVGLGDKWTL